VPRSPTADSQTGCLSIRGGDRRVDILDGVVVSGSDGAGRVLDATGCSVLPGFVDVQINGGFGIDLTGEPNRVDELAALLPRTGVTSFVPTVVTAPPEVTARALQVLGDAPAGAPGAAQQLGVHLEGPFLHPDRKGAHDARHLRAPAIHEVVAWAGDRSRPDDRRLSMVTLAPELPGALDVVRRLVDLGVVVCAGHTSATPAELAAAADAGVTGATHLYNAMGTFGSRDPGAVGALLANPTLICGLIVDGVHVDPLMVTVAWRALGPHQIALVTDAVAALGAPAGAYRIGRIEIVVDDVSARTSTGVLAGSILRMDQAVRNLVAFTGCSLADASIAASATPARLLRRTDVGRLDVGCSGDIVLLDDDLEVAATVVAGHVAYDRDGRTSP
jgi:N-acetylglucosamine-6-phosphate deacetylase